MLPDIFLPAGATEGQNNTPSVEIWWTTAPYEQTINMLEAQLPLGQTFEGVVQLTGSGKGLPFCKGDTGPVSPVVTAWSWATDTEDLTVSVLVPVPPTTTGQQIEVRFQREARPEGDGRQDCTVPLPASVNPEPPLGPVPTDAPSAGTLQHSNKAEIDMPPGSFLMPSNPETVWSNSEIWSYTVSQADMVDWLRQRLPIGQPFHGVPWCEEDNGDSFEWIGGGQRFYAQVEDSVVEFQRGPIDHGC